MPKGQTDHELILVQDSFGEVPVGTATAKGRRQVLEVSEKARESRLGYAEVTVENALQALLRSRPKAKKRHADKCRGTPKSP